MTAFQDIAPVYTQVRGIVSELERLLQGKGVKCEIYKLEASSGSVLGKLEFRPADESGELQPLMGATTLLYENGKVHSGPILTPVYPYTSFAYKSNNIKVREIKFPNAKSLAEQIADELAITIDELQMAKLAEARTRTRASRYKVLGLA